MFNNIIKSYMKHWFYHFLFRNCWFCLYFMFFNVLYNSTTHMWEHLKCRWIVIIFWDFIQLLLIKTFLKWRRSESNNDLGKSLHQEYFYMYSSRHKWQSMTNLNCWSNFFLIFLFYTLLSICNLKVQLRLIIRVI